MAKITFGWRVPDFPEGGASSAAFREQIFHYTGVLEAGGWDSIWVGDHFFPWPGELDQSIDTIEAWTTLTFLLSRYPRLRGGSIVLSQGYRNPAVLAKMAANLHWLSEGRFVLGIGAGWKENEYRAYGLRYDEAPGDRLRALEEALQVIRKMWSEEHPTFSGAYYSIDGAYCAPLPKPPPPLLIGGAGPRKTLKLVAKYGDWCNLNNAPIDFCASRLETLREHCRKVGRNYDEIVKTFAADTVAVASSQEEADRLVNDSFFSKYYKMAGTPDVLAKQIQEYVDLGFTHFIFRFVDFPKTDSAEMFMKEVMPRFA